MVTAPTLLAIALSRVADTLGLDKERQAEFARLQRIQRVFETPKGCQNRTSSINSQPAFDKSPARECPGPFLAETDPSPYKLPNDN